MGYYEQTIAMKFSTQPIRSTQLVMIFFNVISVQQAGEVRRLNSAIGDLRGACDSMVKKVTTLTGGKGEIFQFS